MVAAFLKREFPGFTVYRLLCREGLSLRVMERDLRTCRRLAFS